VDGEVRLETPLGPALHAAHAQPFAGRFHP
jgi:hypothetical protein